MSGGGAKGGTTTTTSGPPSYLQPYYNQFAQAAEKLYTGTGPQYWPGQQVAPFSPLQEQGFSQLQNSAAPAAQQIANQGAGLYNNLTSGSMLNTATNPELSALVSQSDQQIQNNLTSQFAGGGRNIEASAPIQASQMAQTAANIYGGAYNTTLNDMTSALGQTAGLQASQGAPGSMLLGAGNQIQSQAQNILGGNENAYSYYQNLPYQQLQGWSSALTGIPGSSTSTPYYTNPMAGGLSGALTGAKVGSAFGGPGAGIGAGIGGLLGLFGG